VLLLLCLAVASGQADENDQIEQFLNRLGLVELQTVHLEQQLAAENDEAKRAALAKRLADVYSSQLITFAENKQKYHRVSAKIEQLIQRVSSAKTPSLQVMLLQADYNRADGLIRKWIADHNDTVSRDEAKAILARIAPELDRLQKQLSEQYDKLSEKIDYSKEGAQLTAQERELNRLQTILGRATYFAAWSNYYLGLTKGVPESVEYTRARAIFRRLLGIGDDYEGIDAEYLGLSSIWRARSLVGLALAEAALKASKNSDRCFEMLSDPSVPPEVRDQRAYWRLLSLTNVGRYADAVTLARKEIAKFNAAPTQGKVSFCIALIQAGFAGGAAVPQARTLGLLGLGGLVKIGQRQTAKQMIAKYDVKLDDQAGFYLQWIQGQQLFEQAEKSKKQEDYQAAAAVLAKALDDPSSGDDLGSSGQCRSTRAWCLYRLEQYDAAGREFQLAAERLVAAKHKGAFDAAKNAFVCFQLAGKSKPKFKEDAISMLRVIQREFPREDLAKRANYYIGKLRENASPAETLWNLSKVESGSPDYLSARYEICVLSHQQWLRAKAAEKAERGQQTLEAVKIYLAAAKPDGDPAQRARACLIAADVSFNGAPADLPAAEVYVEQAAALVQKLPAGHARVAEYHFRALQLAQKQANEAEQRLHADWIVDKAAGSPYELPALIVMARTIDAAIKASSSPSPQQLAAAYRYYRRLVGLLGDSPEAIRGNKNAQVANSKLAHYAKQIGKYQESASRLDALLAAGKGPKNKGYLRRAGLAHFEAGQYKTAIDDWRTLLRGVPRGSDEWFEAKYFQLACLFQIDAAQARIAFDQFKLLYPNLGPAAWRDKFAALAK